MDNRNSDIVAKLQRWVNNYNNSHGGKGGQAELSKKLNISTTAISQYLNGSYPTPGRIEEVFTEFLSALEDSSELYRAPEYVPTSISSEIYESIKNAHLTSSIAIEYGDAGVGKTKAARKYLKDHPNSTIMLTANPNNGSNVAFLRTLCRLLGVPVRNRADMFDDCIDRLRGKKVLIIDEAQNLSVKAIETIRSLWDSTETDVGIVMIGNHAVVGNMRGRNAEAFAQLNNRVMRRPIRCTKDILQEDIIKMFPAVQKDSPEAEFLHEVAKSLEGMRGTVNLYTLAANNGNTEYEGLVAAAKYLRMELRYR